ASSWKWGLPRQRDMRVLGCPNRLETALLERAGKLHRRHRIIGEEHRATELHPTLLCVCPAQRRGYPVASPDATNDLSDETRCHVNHVPAQPPLERALINGSDRLWRNIGARAA